MNALTVKGLCKRYPAFSLENVNFSVPEGAVMGFIGRNGAGKSTTLKALLGLVHPDAGEVTVLGKSFREEERYIKERIGVVLGGIDFYPAGSTATGRRRSTVTTWICSALTRRSGWISCLPA